MPHVLTPVPRGTFPDTLTVQIVSAEEQPTVWSTAMKVLSPFDLATA